MEEILRSPAEVGSLSYYLQGFTHPNGGWPWDFWTINSRSWGWPGVVDSRPGGDAVTLLDSWMYLMWHLLKPMNTYKPYTLELHKYMYNFLKMIVWTHHGLQYFHLSFHVISWSHQRSRDRLSWQGPTGDAIVWKRYVLSNVANIG